MESDDPRFFRPLRVPPLPLTLPLLLCVLGGELFFAAESGGNANDDIDDGGGPRARRARSATPARGDAEPLRCEAESLSGSEMRRWYNAGFREAYSWHFTK